MACVPEADEGDYVIVHAGIAISRIDAQAAQRVFETLAELEDTDGWVSSSVSDDEEQALRARRLNAYEEASD
jgi:hydrogenase expression/formation protein HypC